MQLDLHVDSCVAVGASHSRTAAVEQADDTVQTQHLLRALQAVSVTSA